MHIPVCYCPPDCFRGDKIVIPNEEARHIKRVLRLKSGERLITVDGEGHAYEGLLIEDEKWGGASMQIEQKFDNWGEPKVHLTLAFGLSAGSKTDEIVEKGTELGVSRFVPLVTSKSKVKLDVNSQSQRKSDRLTRVAVAAMKQCRRSFLPEICEPRGIDSFLKECNASSTVQKLLFHPQAESRVLESSLVKGKSELIVITGAESGFSDEEVAAAQKAGCLIVSLGSRVLRAENAAPIACALIMQLAGELG
jgi:16S rRNA (uracil1498-N3)-methyltransferase